MHKNFNCYLGIFLMVQSSKGLEAILFCLLVQTAIELSFGKRIKGPTKFEEEFDFHISGISLYCITVTLMSH